MKLRDIVLALSLPFFSSCTTEEIISNKIISIKYYPMGVSGALSEETLLYNNKKIKIISIKDNGYLYPIVFAPKDSELINLVQKHYKSDEIIFITSEKTEKVIIN